MYRLEVYRYTHELEEVYKANDIEEILFWFRDVWAICVEKGTCYFYLYKDGNKLEFTKTKELGFYDEYD